MSYRDRNSGGTKIYVGNLSSTTTRGDLEYEFEYYGHLINVWVAKNPPGFAYIEFEDSRDAADAIRGLDGRELHGRRIRVERSHGIPRRSEGVAGRFGGTTRRPFHPSDRCYNCGDSGHYAYDCDLYNRRNRGRSRRSYSRSRSRSRRRSRRSRSYTRSRSRSRRRSHSRSRSRSYTRSRSRGKRSHSRGRSYSRSRERSEKRDGIDNRDQSSSRSRSRSN